MGINEVLRDNGTLQCKADETQPGVVVKALVDGAFRRARVRSFHDLVGYAARIYDGLPYSYVDVTYTDDEGDVIHVVEEREFDEAVRFISSTPRMILRMQQKRDSLQSAGECLSSQIEAMRQRFYSSVTKGCQSQRSVATPELPVYSAVSHS